MHNIYANIFKFEKNLTFFIKTSSGLKRKKKRITQVFFQQMHIRRFLCYGLKISQYTEI